MLDYNNLHILNIKYNLCTLILIKNFLFEMYMVINN